MLPFPNCTSAPSATGHQFADEFRHRDFKWIRNAETRAMIGGGFDGRNDFRMRMAEDGRPPGEDVIHVFVPVHVPNVRALAGSRRTAAADGRGTRAPASSHTTGNVFSTPRRKFFGFSAHKIIFSKNVSAANLFSVRMTAPGLMLCRANQPS